MITNPPVTGEIEARGCVFCKTPIAECMGFVLARDAFPPDSIFKDRPRELCQKCADLAAELFLSPYALDRASGDGVLTDSDMQAIFERIYTLHNGRNGKDRARATALGAMRAALSAVSKP